MLTLASQLNRRNKVHFACLTLSFYFLVHIYLSFNVKERKQSEKFLVKEEAKVTALNKDKRLPE